MILLPLNLFSFHSPKITSSKSNSSNNTKSATSENARCSQTVDDVKSSKKNKEANEAAAACNSRFCPCVTRRRLLRTITSSSAFLPVGPSFGSDPPPNHPLDVLNKIHPPRPEWYEELYASVLENGMRAYEEEISGYKSRLFSSLRGTAKKVLEIGIGTGPNLKYYAHEAGVHVFGVDPNRKMEKYARKAAYNAGVPPSNFTFVQAVVEALPLSDASVDAVVGTLVLCSVQDVDLALNEVIRVLKPGGLYVFVEHVAAEDGTTRRYIQGILDPLQQIVADGCHLTRQTGNVIAKAGFSSFDIQQAFLSSASIINPHVYGIAQK